MSLSYEQAVLGAVMLDGATFWKVADLIGEADFSDKRHAEIFGAIRELCKQGKPVDAVMMGDVLPQYDTYMIEMASNATASNVRAYAEEVRLASEGRRVTAAGQRIALGGVTYGEAQRILADVAPRNTDAIKPIRAYMGGALELMMKRCEQEEVVTGLPTGIDALDEATSGLQPGTVIIIAARPSMGKTALALQLAIRTAVRKKRVAVFEMEMTGVQLSERGIAQISGVNYGHIKSPKNMLEEEWPRITNAFAMLEGASLIVDESSTQTIDTLEARIRQLHMESPLELVVIDHLGLIALPGKVRADLETGEVTRRLKALAKDLQIPIICLVQLNRGVEARADKRPIMSDLRESGRIEEDADLVMMIYRDEYYNANSPHKGYAELLLRKNREGEMKMIPLISKLHIMRFEGCEGLPNANSNKSDSPIVDFGSYADRKTAPASSQQSGFDAGSSSDGR
jgi:replicative DNA helicase